MTSLTHKSWADLRRRPARAVFTVVTIAFAVAGLWISAMPPLMDRAMQRRITEDRLHDARIPTSDVVLGDAELGALRAVPGVEALTARTLYATKIVDGNRRRDVLLVGIPAWEDQQVNVVVVDAGTAPEGAQLVTDRMNGRTGRYRGAIGDRVSLLDPRGVAHPFTVSGRGDTMNFSQIVADEVAVLYAPQAAVDELAGLDGVNSVELRVDPAADAADVAAAVQRRLTEVAPGVTFTDIADVRGSEAWPGKEVFDNFSALLYVGAFLALISALVLISNTMTTMVAEQRREVAVMKAIGGRRRQIRRSFLRTALYLGVAGTVLGIALGIPFANLALGFIADRFFGARVEWGVPVPTVVVSVVVGLGVTALAALPALRRAARTSVRAGLEPGLSGGRNDAADRLLRRLPLPHTTRVGLRNVTRRRTRSLATVLQITLALGVAVGFLGLGATVADVTANVWDTVHWDVVVAQRSTSALDGTAARVISTTDGVATAEPVLANDVEVDGTQYEAFGLAPGSTMSEPDLATGRWLEPADDAGRRNVVVIGRALAETAHLEGGDTMRTGTATGPVDLEVVGIDRRLFNNGTGIYLPLATFQAHLGRADTNVYWVTARSQDERTIEELATSLEDRLTAAGYPVRTEIHHVEKAANLDANRVLVAVLAVMGVPIVLIGLIGLLNAMTMNVIDRTRDVGILRCVGASSRHVRRIFRVEALTVAVVASAIGVPVGYLLGRFLSWLVTDLFHYGSVPFTFPVAVVAFTILATLALAWLVVIGPLRRAVRLQPGLALRYE
jgi:putative ABC transport system permease protein